MKTIYFNNFYRAPKTNLKDQHSTIRKVNSTAIILTNHSKLHLFYFPVGHFHTGFDSPIYRVECPKFGGGASYCPVSFLGFGYVDL